MVRKNGDFIALDDKPMYISAVKSREKYYPTAHINKAVPGLKKVGEVLEVRMKIRVSSLSASKDGRKSTGLELLGIRIEEEPEED